MLFKKEVDKMTAKLLTLFGVVLLLVAMPSALAANGDGVVVNYKPDVASVKAPVTLEIEFTNDATDGSCLDELIITAPDTWDGEANVADYDRGSFTQSNEAADGCVNLVSNDLSVRIIPAQPICPGETVNIEIDGLFAASDYEVSEIEIWTSDQAHNAGATCIRAQIDENPVVYVTHATQVKLEYFHIKNVVDKEAFDDFDGEARGAWARLSQLHLDADGGDLEIWMETGSIDTKIFDDTLGNGDQTIDMDYTNWESSDNGANVKDGYIRDGTTRAYYVTYTGSTLKLLGSEDEILDDEKLTESGLVGAQGTIITVSPSAPYEQRKILVQLTDDDGYDIDEEIPVHAQTDRGVIVSVPPYMTDTDGNAYFTLEPRCDAGLANVEIYTDPLATTPSVTEVVGIDAGPAYSYEVTAGKDAEVPAGQSQLIEVTVYDECGNQISDTGQVKVNFNYLSGCGPINKLAQVPGGPSHDYEYDYTDMGIADVYLVTDCNLCTHEVGIEVVGIGSEVITLESVVGEPYAMQVTIDEAEITADQCVEALIEVVDECGNRVVEIIDDGGQVQQWESLVGVYIQSPLPVDQPGWAASSQTFISLTTLREEEMGCLSSYVMGKLNWGAATVEICGCQGLGVFDVVAESDTLEPGMDSVSVKNAAPDCIETTIVDSEGYPVDQLLQCEREAYVDVAIKDICGNYLTNQDCLGGPAMDCIDLSLGGTCMPDGASLSTSTVCVDVGLGGSGKVEVPVTIFRETEDCCTLEVLAVETTSCCDTTWDLEQCEPNTLLFHGAPAYMTTRFESVNPANQWLVDDGKQIVSEEVRDVFEVWDECGHIVKDFCGTVDVELTGEDCVSYIEVESPIVCEEPEKGEPNGDLLVLDKIVIDNCKEEVKRWTDLEEEDIVVDKLAFDVEIPGSKSCFNLEIWAETENAPGFQSMGPGMDHYLTEFKVCGSGQYVAELPDYPGIFGWHVDLEWLFRGAFLDDQRDGGWLIEGGDSQDFYVVISSNDAYCSMPGDTYSAKFAYYQDYNSPDITDFLYGGYVRDLFKDGDDHAYAHDARNDDYGLGDPKYAFDYGFGDRVLYELQFKNGVAYMDFRDLVAENVQVHVLGVDETCAIRSAEPNGHMCEYDVELDDAVMPNPEEIEFISQPATQVVMINHDLEDWFTKVADCGDEIDPFTNGYHINLQTADGFQNDHAKEIEVELDYCLKWPFGDMEIEQAIESFCMVHPWSDICDPEYMVDFDKCFTREDYKEFLADTEFGEYWGDVLFGDFFGSEFADWMDQYFMNAEVVYYGSSGDPLPYNSRGKQVVMTDANGQAEVWATSPNAGMYLLSARPEALDMDITFARFWPSAAYSLDIVALPSFGVPADGEEEAMLLLRALDVCGNPVWGPVEDVTVTAGGEQVYISEDFNGNNNYDNEVEGTLYSWYFGNWSLRVLSDLPQTSTITASAYGLESDTTQIAFQGAPVQLKVVEITPSDRLPADGKTGAWVTVQVQDMNGNRVTGYLGDGYSGDPKDPLGMTDYLFENICVGLSDTNAFIPLGPPLHPNALTFGWMNFHYMPFGPMFDAVYCGDLMFGEGSFYVVYGNEDCNHGGTVDVTVFDMCPFNGQEVNENGLPYSVHATQLDPDSGSIDFVDPASQWNVMADKQIALADGKSKVLIEVQIENEYMDVRQPVEGIVYIGGTAEDGASLSWNGMTDELNPTSARFVTDPKTGSTYLELTSTKPGIAEITVTGGDAYICLGVDDITLSGCIEMCETRLKPLGEDCLSLCLSGDIGIYDCPTCEEYVPKFWCHYSGKEDLTPKTIEVEFLEVADNELYLDAGWNFVSVPYALEYDTVAEVFDPELGEAVYAWDAASQSWDLLIGSDTIEPLEGYWVKMNEAKVVSLEYANPSFPSIPTKTVKPGWNAVGLTWDSPMLVQNALISIQDVWSQLIGWIAGQGYDMPVANVNGDGPMEAGGAHMQPKAGYWIWVTDEAPMAGIAALGG